MNIEVLEGSMNSVSISKNYNLLSEKSFTIG